MSYGGGEKRSYREIGEKLRGMAKGTGWQYRRKER